MTEHAEASKKHHRFVYQDDEIIEKNFDYSLFKRLAEFVKPYTKSYLMLIVILTLLGAAAKLTIPILVMLAIDNAIKTGNVPLLLGLVSMMILLFGIQWITNAYRIKMTNRMGQNILYDLRSKLFKHIQGLSFHFFDKRPAGSILVRITNDVNALQELLTNGIVNLLIDIVQLTGIVIILLVLNVKLALAIMVTVPLMFILSTELRKRIRRAWQNVRIKQSRLNSHLNESIQGIRVTQAYVQEKENIQYFHDMNYGNKKSWDKASALNQSFGPVIEFTSGIGMCILFWFGTYLLIHDATITVGIMLAFAQYISNFWEPITRLGQLYSQVLIAMASSERIFEFMDEKPSVDVKKDAKPLPPIQGNIELQQVVFEYEKDRPALKGINLSVEPGQSIALVGHTGSGKSTIINLLCRFYDPVQGRVLVDGHDLREVTLDSLRQQIGIVLQDTFIFSGTIRDNIRYGRLEATDEEVELAARAVGADEFIRLMPDGYDTEVEERGGILSMGQRQLISFARALLADPNILILDEATASIDTETEVKIQSALKTLLTGRTSFIVAHRLSTIRHADKIVVLDHGEIMEIGSHEELMAKPNGTYRRLIEAQYRYLDAV